MDRFVRAINHLRLYFPNSSELQMLEDYVVAGDEVAFWGMVKAWTG
jgi:hypothetical protein